jgi:hypothetical protein
VDKDDPVVSGRLLLTELARHSRIEGVDVSDEARCLMALGLGREAGTGLSVTEVALLTELPDSRVQDCLHRVMTNSDARRAAMAEVRAAADRLGHE